MVRIDSGLVERQLAEYSRVVRMGVSEEVGIPKPFWPCQIYCFVSVLS